MHRLELNNGTSIPVTYLGNYRFFCQSAPYWELSQENLAFAYLYDDDDLPVEVLVDFEIQNYCVDDGATMFKLAPVGQKMRVREK